jgi:hypothetical protein
MHALTQKHGASLLYCVSGDFNTELVEDGFHVGSNTSGTCVDDRVFAVHSWLATWNLVAVFTFLSPKGNWTHRAYNGGRTCVLDYCCVSSVLAATCLDFRMDYERNCATDHVAQILRLMVSWKKGACKRRRRTALDVGAFADFWQERPLPDNLEHLTELCTRALKLTAAPALSREKAPMPLELKNRYAALQEATSKEESFACAREIYRLRRKWRDDQKLDSFARDALKMPRSDRKLGARVTELEVAGVKTSDAALWAQGILDFYRGLYTDTTNDTDGRLRRLRAEAKNEGYIQLPRWIVERSRVEARQRVKSAPGNDGVTWGVINALPTRVLDHFACLFEKRLNSEDECFVKQWTTVR